MTEEYPLTVLTSQSLLSCVRRSAPGSWERMSTIYGPLVYQWARRCGLFAEDSADIVQDVFAVLSQRMDAYQGVGKFRGWLWTITRNKVRDHLRRSRDQAIAVGGSTAYGYLQQLPADEPEPWSADQKPSEDLNGAAPWTCGELGVAARTLDLIRAEFEQTTWKAFWISTIEKRTAADTAAALGMTKHAVHQAKYRVLRRLREEFEEFTPS